MNLVEECDDLHDFVTRVFSKDPAPENSVMLDLHPEDIVTATNNTDHFVFRLLGQIITMGIVHIYGDQIPLHSLTIEQITRIKQYMKSLGYDVWIDEEITKNTTLPENQGRYLPWILKIRNVPSEPFHSLMFCKLSIHHK